MSPAGSGTAAEWDARLGAWPAANLLQSHGWGEVQARVGWSTHRLEVDTTTGMLPVSAQVTTTGLPGFTRIYVPRGPVCTPLDVPAFQAVVRALMVLGREQRALAVELEVPWVEGTVPAGHPWLDWAPVPARQPLATVVVDLRPEPAAILASFRDKTRYNVRLAERRGVVINEAAVLADLIACLEATEVRQRIHLPSPEHLAVVLDQLGSSARILTAEVEGEVVAAILTASFAGESIYLYGGATGQHRDRMPNQLLQWRAMLRAREEGCDRYDLWGIPENADPHHPWRGLAQFKLGFGGDQVRFAGARSRQLRPGGATILRVTDAARHKVRTRGRR
ncbi:MAG TPA: peptidoglycan bridge formation glycyltransferase FemA/FemB family protein [Candidatus Dormibacteraeota bacterium]|nr:peptidoglycan bridge formation glycyltransferase FemA/FemB family protein [Candidatus Dormibacteraeota bacterium]